MQAERFRVTDEMLINVALVKNLDLKNMNLDSESNDYWVGYVGKGDNLKNLLDNQEINSLNELASFSTQ